MRHWWHDRKLSLGGTRVSFHSNRAGKLALLGAISWEGDYRRISGKMKGFRWRAQIF